MNKRLSKMGWIVLAALLCLSLVLMPGCTTAPAEQEEEEEEISIPYKNDGMFVQETIGDLESLDPAWCYDTASGEQISYIYEPLIFFDGEKTDEFVPVLATAWEFNSEDLTYTFTIRDGVKFHEGGDLTPEDVEYSFERAMVQDRPGGPIWMFFQPLLGEWGSSGLAFADIDAAVEVDGDSVVFSLSGPAWELPFLQIVAGPWASIVDKEWCVAQGDWDGTEATWMDYNQPSEPGDTVLFDESNGTGPWKLNLWEKAIQTKLEKFDGYWQGSVPFDWVITKVVDEWTLRKLSLLNGDADLVYVPRMFIGELEGIEDLNVYEALPSLVVDSFFFNMAINPDSDAIGSGALDGNGIPPDFFTDLDVRKGFNYAFDWEVYIKDALVGEGEQRGSPIIEGLYGFNPDASMYSRDLDKAEEHLKAAWGGEVWEKGFKFTLFYNAGNLPRKTACEILAEGLLSLNEDFRVSIQPLTWPTILYRMYGARDMGMYQIGWLADYPHADNFVVPFMHSTGTFADWQAYGYPELDAKIEAAFQETDPTEQLALYYELQEIYYEDAPGIMLCQPLGRRYFTKYISGFYFNAVIPGNAGPLYYMSKSES